MRIGIFGYGNLGKSIERAVSKQDDLHLIGIFTRRDPSTVHSHSGTNVYPAKEVLRYIDKIDVLINCGGSLSDLPLTSPYLASHFNLVDAFDTHARIKEHYDAVHEASLSGKKTAMIAAGWDPGLFSLFRILAASFLPEGKAVTLWGPGVSQGHSDAIRRISGVKRGVEYTIPMEEKPLLEALRAGERLTENNTHTRDCYVVLNEKAVPQEVENTIKSLPNYFEGYKTIVHFIDETEFERCHNSLPHAGAVIAISAGEGPEEMMTLRLKLASNPDFTANILVSCARAVHRLYEKGVYGAKTVADVPPSFYLADDSTANLYSYL